MRPRELPIFPLPLVLFPGAPQPLHIFKPSYRQMLADCETGDHTFGVLFAPMTSVALVEPYDDEPAEQHLAPETAHVRPEYTRLAEALAMLNAEISSVADLPDDPGRASFRLAAALDVSMEAKQQLLELRSPGARLRALRGILGRLNEAAATRLGLHMQTRRNGKVETATALDK